jgi:ADP-heptose:LPS heptosyltransferase
MALLRRVSPHSGLLARLVRYPNPFARPWRRPVLDVVNDAGLGDVIMCTPGLRELKRRNPKCHVRFYSKFGLAVQGLPYIDEVLPYEDRPSPAVYMDYSDLIPPRARLIPLMADRLGLRLADEQPDCAVDPHEIARYHDLWQAYPRPHIIVQRRGSGFTPNKDWPDGYWTTLTARLRKRGTVIEVGAATDPTAAAAENYIDLRGQTTLPQLMAAIGAADLYIGPSSGPMHIAAAQGKPLVVIYGGYEHPSHTPYPRRVALYTQVPCAPCWLNTACPYDRKCFAAISPATVEEAAWSLVSQPN